MLFNSSGCYSTTDSQIKTLDETRHCHGIVSKSATLTPCNGNTHPRLYIDDNVCINANGLSNLGLSYYNNIKTKKLFIQSVYAYNIDEIEPLLKTTSEVIEFNLSCPNLTKLNFESYLKRINEYRGDKLIGIKMPPLLYPSDFDYYSNLLNYYDIDFITCCNNIPNCLIIKENSTAIYPNRGLGGVSLKALSLSNVYQFYTRFNGEIIGCGGIKSGRDVYDYILCGATAVQIGATLLREGPTCFERIYNEFKLLIHNQDIDDIKGKVTVCSKL
jgi:dihydroorotate dehydrogenase (fumarate)